MCRYVCCLRRWACACACRACPMERVRRATTCRAHLHGEAGQVARSSRLRERDTHARCAAQRERRRAQAGGLVSGGERTQAHDVECGGGGGAEGEDVARVGRAAVVREQERA